MTVTSAAPTGAAIDSGGDRRRWLALAVVMTAAFMDLVDVTIVNVAIPSVQRDLGASFGAIQWITAGYALAFAVGLITGGRLGDIYGRKKLFLTGISLFTLASGLCGLAVSPEMLVGSRVLQGAGAALMVPQVLAIIHVTFTSEERGKVFGLYGAMVGLGAVAGPLLGSLLTQWDIFGLEWRPIFLVNLPIGLIGIVLGVRYVRESRSANARSLDLVGTALVTIALLMLLYPLTEGRELGWPVWSFVLMGASVPVLALFVVFEYLKARTIGSPLVDLSLFRIKSFAAGIGVQAVFMAATGIFFLIWTLYMQLGLGWSTLHAGMTAVPFSIGVGAAAGVSVQVLVPRFGRKVLQAGALLMAATMGVYILQVQEIGDAITTWDILPTLVFMGAGMGLIIAPLPDAILSEVPRASSGSASGLISTMQQIGWSVGLGLVSIAFFASVDGVSMSDPARSAAYGSAFSQGLWWVIGGLVVACALMFALPKKVEISGEPVGVE